MTSVYQCQEVPGCTRRDPCNVVDTTSGSVLQSNIPVGNVFTAATSGISVHCSVTGTDITNRVPKYALPCAPSSSANVTSVASPRNVIQPTYIQQPVSPISARPITYTAALSPVPLSPLAYSAPLSPLTSFVGLSTEPLFTYGTNGGLVVAP